MANQNYRYVIDIKDWKSKCGIYQEINGTWYKWDVNKWRLATSEERKVKIIKEMI